ncbi:MAG: nucleotide exchange factor GrpE, partial [Candidatus Omnitrophica bacterium]|nr:nucleotide exchange factor GrpE [Candidatus Omnitrophota bacterium]
MIKGRKENDRSDATEVNNVSAENTKEQGQGHEAEKTVEQKPEVKIAAEEYETLKSQAAEFAEGKEKLLRAMADFENSKKRNEKQKEEFIQYANKKIILEFLPIMDNLTRAVESAKSNHSVESMIEGVDLINKQLQDILKGHGLEKI